LFLFHDIGKTISRFREISAWFKGGEFTLITAGLVSLCDLCSFNLD